MKIQNPIKIGGGDTHKKGVPFSLRFSLFAASVSAPMLATAYIGPAAGITMVGALWAVILAVVFAIGGLLIWPLRAMLSRKKAAESSVGSLNDIAQTNASQAENDTKSYPASEKKEG